MSITLTHSATTVTLSDDLSWIDEFDWHPVEQTQTYTTTGALIVESATRQAGRPITLAGAEDRAWCTRATCQQLAAWAAIPGATFTLTLRGAPRTVAFDHASAPAFSAKPVVDWADSSFATGDWYYTTLKLIEV